MADRKTSEADGNINTSSASSVDESRTLNILLILHLMRPVNPNSAERIREHIMFTFEHLKRTLNAEGLNKTENKKQSKFLESIAKGALAVASFPKDEIESAFYDHAFPELEDKLVNKLFDVLVDGLENEFSPDRKKLTLSIDYEFYLLYRFYVILRCA